MMAVMEIFIGVGYAVGPPVGGVMFDRTGFRFVFVAFAGFVFLSSIAMWSLLPSAYHQRKAPEGRSKSACELLGDARILIDLVRLSMLKYC